MWDDHVQSQTLRELAKGGVRLAMLLLSVIFISFRSSDIPLVGWFLILSVIGQKGNHSILG